MINLKKICEEKGLTNLDIGEFSDGFHAFNSLYNQRLILFAALANNIHTSLGRLRDIVMERSALEEVGS